MNLTVIIEFFFFLSVTYPKMRRIANMPPKSLAAAWTVAMAPQPTMRVGSMILPENRLVNRLRGRSHRPFGM